ncbi:MAG: hypothetical protein AB7R89_08270 [Dehalococcoidia bacterium]
MSDPQPGGAEPRPSDQTLPAQGVTLRSLRDLASLRDFVPAAVPEPPSGPDTSLPRAVFPWLAARIGARRRDNLPLSEASLRGDVALGFAAQIGEAFVWPEALYEGENGPRLNLLIRPPESKPAIAVACQFPRRANPGQLPATARQFGDLLRDSLRLSRSFGEKGLPVQVLLCTDEFRSYLSTLRPPLRILRPDVAGTEVRVELLLNALDDGTLTRLADSLTEQHTTLHLALDVLGYAPVGPLHLGMWRVIEARIF